jgi:hypothetical protein
LAIHLCVEDWAQRRRQFYFSRNAGETVSYNCVADTHSAIFVPIHSLYTKEAQIDKSQEASGVLNQYEGHLTFMTF